MNRTIQFLESADLDTAQLGAVYLEKECRRDLWDRILSTYLHPSLKWFIDNNGNITIQHRFNLTTGVWQQLSTTNTAVYARSSFSTTILSTAISQYYNIPAQTTVTI